ncbi:MAG: hypothetical protein CVV27_05885 [Candidatus Melainabacteria bacterium HGW-Melainabacteria-1]|nr:MAG: hypothetical protein CVV27_05885 [Candidatus Melainabacteria bacterium HGW-Melainabacteria-1]
MNGLYAIMSGRHTIQRYRDLQDPPINQLLQQAYALHQQGRHSEARKLYDRVHAREPGNQDALVLLGALCYETEAYDEAVSWFARLRQLAPERTDFLANLGAALQMTGRSDEAIPIYQIVAETTPSAAAWYNLGSALKDGGQAEAAIQAFERALAIAPEHARAHNNLGALYRQLQRPDQALVHFERAVELQPDYAMGWQNLADLQRTRGQLQAAEVAYQQVLGLQPGDATLRYKLGTLYQLLGQLEASASHLKTAVELSPRMAEAWRSLGATQQAQGLFAESIQSFETALELRSDYAEAWNNLGNSRRELGQMEQAVAAYEQALRLQPIDANRLRLATLLPPIYASMADVSQWRERLNNGIAELATAPLEITDPLSEIGQTNFYLAYQGGDDRPLQEAIAALYRPLLPEAANATATTTPVSTGDGRLRVGVLSAFLYNHSITHYYGRHLELLAADPLIELVLLFAPGGEQDAVSDELKAKADRSLQLPRDLELARQQIAELGLDVLVYPDIGLEPFSYFLAFTRLAPVQCVLPGHPVTTGIPTIDYFVSNTWMEGSDAEAGYSEQLVRLDSLPVWYRKPSLPEHVSSRAELGLDPQKRLYLCPMTLFKIHPEMDQALAAILAADPEAEICFFRFRRTLLHELLAQRFAQTIPDHARIRFLPWAERQDFFSLLHQADVLLDSFHFGGGSTHFLCFATGTPMITWPSDYLRGRSGAGLYQRIGIQETIAESPADYARLAVAIATDPERRAAIRQQILDSHGVLFENDEGPQAFVAWLKSLAG